MRAFRFKSGRSSGSIAGQRERDAGAIGATTASQGGAHTVRAATAGDLEADAVAATATREGSADAVRAAAAGESGRSICWSRLQGYHRGQRNQGNRGNNHFFHRAHSFHRFRTNVNGGSVHQDLFPAPTGEPFSQL